MQVAKRQRPDKKVGRALSTEIFSQLVALYSLLSPESKLQSEARETALRGDAESAAAVAACELARASGRQGQGTERRLSNCGFAEADLMVLETLFSSGSLMFTQALSNFTGDLIR